MGSGQTETKDKKEDKINITIPTFLSKAGRKTAGWISLSSPTIS